MAIDRLLVILGTYACMVGPYHFVNSRSESSYSSRLVVLDYDRLPPHLQLYQLLKGRNWVLSTITIAIILENVLAVALAGYSHHGLGLPYRPPMLIGVFPQRL